MNTHVLGKVLSLSSHVIVIFEQLILSSKAYFSANVNVFNKIITTITNVLKKNAHDQNEQTIIFTSGVSCLPHFCPEI